MAVLDDRVKQRALDATRTLAQLGTVRAAYVFGSYADGRADEWSDIDLAVFMDGIETWGIRRRARAMVQVQREAGLDVEAHLFPASAHDRPQRASFAEYVIRHGVSLSEDAG